MPSNKKVLHCVVDVWCGGCPVWWMSGVVDVLFYTRCGGCLVWWMSVWWMSYNPQSLRLHILQVLQVLLAHLWVDFQAFFLRKKIAALFLVENCILNGRREVYAWSHFKEKQISFISVHYLFRIGPQILLGPNNYSVTPSK